MDQDNILLSVKNLSKRYEGLEQVVEALKGVSFTVTEGELLAIMGTSGSGKSTLLHILGAMDEPTEGMIDLNGVSNVEMFKEPNATYYRRNNVGFIFQSFNLLKDLTISENIALPLILKDMSDHEIEKKVEGMIERLGLTRWKNHRPSQLSGGQQQRVAIGRALITEPPIILADELTGNLDFNTTTEILQLLVEMKMQYNQSMILVTHDAYVAQYADRVLFFHDGQIVDEYICQQEGTDMTIILQKFREIMVKRHDDFN